MYQFSVFKTRLVFVVFFFVLAIPSITLSFQAHKQLRWQSLHQFRQVAIELVRRIDTSLLAAIKKEEARTDTDYTFFVLAGNPEARFVQRSELSKFPVRSDIAGLVGYFQVDDSGRFSSPILPSAHVQSEVSPALYGISVEENSLRQQLEQRLKDILATNKLATKQLSERKSEHAKLEIDETENSELEDSGLSDQLVITESRVQSSVEKSSNLPSKSKLSKKNAFYSAIEQKRQQSAKKSKQSDYQLNEKTSQSRRARTEKNYSPQQSLAVDQQSDKRIESDEIKLRLFESEIEPFKFSRLESGHFVLYRQVWRNNKRIVQGAIVDAKLFIGGTIRQVFEQSSLADVANLSVFFGEQLLERFDGGKQAYGLSASQNLTSEGLAEISLSDPFGQFILDFRVITMPPAAGSRFVILVASVLILGLILGTYFLYRLVLKQSFLVQQQQDFVSSVSHELKTPLTSIRMYGEILKQGWVSEEKKMEYYDYIYSESERLSRLIANVLQIAGMNRHALELKQEFTTTSELASLIRSKVDSQIEQSGFQLKLVVDAKVENKSILVDKDAFIQIIINLVDNAIKYAGKADLKRIDIRFRSASVNSVSISVRDYGPGISNKHLKRVFDLFYRSGEEMTREVKGTGIGLALVKELATAMSAKIGVKNRQPGCEFVIIFSQVD